MDVLVYELVDRPTKQLCCSEYYIETRVNKHNDGFGYYNDDFERNTPQTFSHFSFEDSNGQSIIVDIQGIGNVYSSMFPTNRKIEKGGVGNRSRKNKCE